MIYQTFAPPVELRSVVRYFWTLEDSSSDVVQKTFRTMADGCPGLIYQHADYGSFYQQDKQLPQTFLFGQTTRHAEINLSGKFNTVGVYLHPNALKAVFGYNAEELTDSCLDINEMPSRQGSRVADQLASTTSANDKIDILSTYLSAKINENNKRQDGAMQYALSQIIHSNGTISLKHLQNNLKLSERSFQRSFKQHTGISPKLFSRICRFQACLKQLRKTDYNKLSDIAFANDYADQSHFIRSFKEFAGLSPNQYHKQANELVENFAEVL